MKQTLIIIIGMVLAISTNGQNTITLETGALTDDISSTVPTRDIDISTDGVTVTYSINAAVIQKDDLFKGCYWWKMDGFGLEEEPSKPSMLNRIDQFTIPTGMKAKLTIEESSYKEFNYRLTPARQPLTDSGNEVYTSDNVMPIDKSIGIYPNEIVCIEDVQAYRGNNILNVRVSPIQYDPVAEKVRAYTKIVYRITFASENKAASSEGASMPAMAADDNFLSNTTFVSTIGKSQTRANGGSQLNEQDYLILTVNKYATAVNTLAKWKRTLGFNVHIISKEYWISSNEVKDSIQALYNSTPTLYYLLIVGDHEDVPASASSLDRNHVTDFFYGCMNGDSDYTPDIYRGRLSVSSELEASIVVNKIVFYERYPVANASFYNTGVNCAYFQDTNNYDTYADRRFAQTSEDVRNYLLGQGKTIQRIYTTKSNVTPKYWNNGLYSKGEAIPSDLLKPTFAWDGDSTDIIAAINQGAFYVLHRDHGAEWGWGDPYFKRENIASLSNGIKMPVVFSMNCLTGMFNGRTCFAETFLRKSSGGCVAIYGATEASYSGYNDVLTGGMFDAIWPTPGLRIVMPSQNSTGITPSPTYRLGQILDQGLARMSEIYGANLNTVKYTKELFHCFGDPSMQIYTAMPTSFTDITLNRGANNVSVALDNGSTATISFYNLVTGEVKSYIGSSASYSTAYPQNVTVCVSAHNKRPYVNTGTTPTTIYIQNETITGEASYDATFIKVGTNATTTKAPGPVVFQNGNITLKASKIEISPNTTISNQTTFKAIIK